jgi:BirA family biotin operon repressor/biotin-[acetyl-CoA-carboxylase] ligase
VTGIHRLATCASTNAEADALARAGAPAWTVVVADAQTGGRGRLGRTWYSPPGVNLYVSVVFRPHVPMTVVPRIAITAAVALAEAVERVVPEVEPELKWPNDLLVGGRKVAGVLADLSAHGEAAYHVVLGVGINVNLLPEQLPLELRSRATSLRAAAGHEVDREALLGALLERLRLGMERFEASGGQVDTAAWLARARTDRVVRVGFPEGRILAVASGLRADGALVVRTLDGRLEEVVAGDVIPVEWEG